MHNQLKWYEREGETESGLSTICMKWWGRDPERHFIISWNPLDWGASYHHTEHSTVEFGLWNVDVDVEPC